MSAITSHDTIAFGGASLTTPMSSTAPPVGPVVTALAATLTVEVSLSFSGLDTWSFDNYIAPGPQDDLGSGDAIIVYRHIFNCLLTPAFTCVLGVKVLNTGIVHPRSIRLPITIVRFSVMQHLRRFLLPFPRSSPPPVPVVPHHRIARHSVKGRPIGDQVARDSDDLPIWDTQARRTKMPPHRFFTDEPPPIQLDVPRSDSPPPPPDESQAPINIVGLQLLVSGLERQSIQSATAQLQR
ncbi:hypothetical protein EV702DRAFT_1197426 [Suillus placidus]|uniref:Uncharacterized protein n=1 Tax=Suillus placidus TaxID=48579 RepID=A0A9P7D2V4_9AGAM|nr:hypothetical protein EV702DRAFT_1197426 [Suillus placidus]